MPIDLNDVEAWLDLGEEVAPDDIELFATPPAKQAGLGGDFNSAPRPHHRLNRPRQWKNGAEYILNNVL